MRARDLEAFGIAKPAGSPSVPSALTGKRVTLSCWGTHRKRPSGEYVGPSRPTVLSEYFCLTPGAVPTDQTGRPAA